MNKNELKEVLKPLIKECIKEVIFEEDGALSHIIKEVAGGITAKQQITETKKLPSNPKTNNSVRLNQTKKQLLDAIGKDAYGGINIFEGTTPAPAASMGQTEGPLSGQDPSDPGVDISNLFGEKAFKMSQRLMGKK